MSSYCTAFAYRPVIENIADDMADIYLEVPEEISVFKNPLTSRCAVWVFQQRYFACHVYLEMYSRLMLMLGLMLHTVSCGLLADIVWCSINLFT